MNPPTHPPVQQLIESMRHASDEKDVMAFAATLEQASQVSSLEQAERLNALMEAGEVLYEKGQYKEARRWLEMGAEEARNVSQKGSTASPVGKDLGHLPSNLASHPSIPRSHACHG